VRETPAREIGESARAHRRLAGAPRQCWRPGRHRQEVHRRRRSGPWGPGGLLGLLLGVFPAAGLCLDPWLRLPQRSLLPEASSRLHAPADARDRSADQRSRRVAHGQHPGPRRRGDSCCVDRTRRHPGGRRCARSRRGPPRNRIDTGTSKPECGDSRPRLARHHHGRRDRDSRARDHRRDHTGDPPRSSASQRRSASTLPCSSRRSGCSQRPR